MTGFPVPTMAAGTSELRQRVERLVRGEGLATEPRRPLWAAPIVAFVLTTLTLLAPSACGVAEAKGLPPSTPAAQKGAAPGSRPTPAALADEEDDNDDEEPVCEEPKNKRKAREHARSERRHGDEHARRHHGRHGPVEDDNDDDEDDNDNDDPAELDEDDDDNEDEEVARGPGRIRVRVPRIGAPEVDVRIDPQVQIDLDRLQKDIEASIPSREALDEQIEQALAEARKQAPDAATRKRIEKDLKRARKDAKDAPPLPPMPPSPPAPPGPHGMGMPMPPPGPRGAPLPPPPPDDDDDD